jgi:hypothetical protein
MTANLCREILGQIVDLDSRLGPHGYANVRIIELEIFRSF